MEEKDVGDLIRDIGDLICTGLIDNREQNQIRSASFYCKLTILSNELVRKKGSEKRSRVFADYHD
jgi:hypothetical protein